MSLRLAHARPRPDPRVYRRNLRRLARWLASRRRA